jgi:hypothetical protein
MDEDQQFLQPRAPLLPTSVPHGVDEALWSIRYERNLFELSYATRLNCAVGLYFGWRP